MAEKTLTPSEHIAALRGGIRNPRQGSYTQSRLEAETQIEVENLQLRAEAAPTLFESFGAAVAGNTDQEIGKAIKRAMFGPKFQPEAGFAPDWKAFAETTKQNADDATISAFRRARSKEETDDVVQRWQEEQERVEAVMAHGAATGVALSFAAELPTLSNILPAVGVAKALAAQRMGSAYLAATGASKGAVIGSAIAENVISGTGVELVRQGVTGKFSVADLGLAALADMTIGLGSAALDIRRGAKYLDMNRAAENVLAHEAAYITRAKQKLGDAATDADVIKEVDSLKAAEVTALRVDAGQSKVADGQRPAGPKQEAAELNQFNEAATSQFFSTSNEARVGREMTSDQRFTEMADLGVFQHADDYPERKLQLDNLNATPGVHLADNIKDNAVYKRHAEVLEDLRQQLIPEVALHYTDGATGLGGNTGVAGVIKPGVSMIAVKPGGGMRAVLHEFSHIVFAHRLSKATPEQQAAMVADWKQWKESLLNTPGKAQEAMLKRSPVAATGDASGTAVYSEALGGKWKHSLADVFGLVFTDRAEQAKFVDYFSNFNEYSAEQLLKYMEAKSLDDAAGELSVPAAVIRMFKALLQSALDVFKSAKEKKVLSPDASFKDFFDSLVVGNRKAGLPPVGDSIEDNLQAMAVPAKPAAVVNEFLTDPDTARFGLTALPVDTPEARKQAQAVLALHKQAAIWETENPLDAAWIKRASNLSDNKVFNVASTGLIMLKSKNPLVRMLASRLVEDASGVVGKRQATAAIAKQVVYEGIMGNVTLDLENAYNVWAKSRPGGWYDEMVKGNNRAAWNEAITEEIEARRQVGGPVTTDLNVKAAADAVEATYQRSANAMRKAGTLGAAGLPTSSVGYMSHRMSPTAVFNATNEQRQVIHGALVDQFVTIEGWDIGFADKIASAYLTRVHSNASGDFSSPMGGLSSATLVREALVGMKLPQAVIDTHMENFAKGAANFTKKRTDLDLNRVYQTTTGEFRLRDVFEKDQLVLLQAQAGRVSGEVALTNFGVQGKPGLELLSTAMKYGEDGKRTELPEHEAFDQIAAEFLNEPFGSAASKWMERAMQANSAIRLGGIVWPQLAETLNAVAHVGVRGMLGMISSAPRLRGEVMDLIKGKEVDNPVLWSLETGGAQFGTAAYRVALPFANADRLYPTYGHDTLTLTDRILRGAGHVQSKISFWRAVHTVQQRGAAEQVTHKIFRYLREGKDDVALQDFGVNENLRKVLRDNLDTVAKFDADGNLFNLDITKLPDEVARGELIQAVHRGVGQIIQGTFIGERGKWVHDGWLRMVTQFRAFPITSMEKQWGRHRNSRGAAAAFGLLVGSMSVAAPIYIARTYAASIGREDQDKFLEERLTAQQITRATLNYVAMSGLTGDFTDALTDSLPDEFRKAAGLAQAAGRDGVDSRFVGNYVLPSLSLADDMWKAIQSRDPADVLRTLPMGRVPWLVPLVNGVRDAAETED